MKLPVGMFLTLLIFCLVAPVPTTLAEDPEICTVTYGDIDVLTDSHVAGCPPNPSTGEYTLQIRGKIYVNDVPQTIGPITSSHMPCGETVLKRYKTTNAPNGGKTVTLQLGYTVNAVDTILNAAAVTACSSPLCVSMNSGSSVKFTNRDNGVNFDLNADGVSERIAWTEDGSVAFIVLDSDDDGVVDNGREMFGNYSQQAPAIGKETSNGFRSLRLYDLNNDGKIDAADAIFSNLKLWMDSNHNGISETNELVPLSSFFEYISLDYRESGWKDKNGNFSPFSSKAGTLNGATRKVFDIFLQ